MDRKTELEAKKAKLEQMRKEKAQKMMVSFLIKTLLNKTKMSHHLFKINLKLRIKLLNQRHQQHSQALTH